MVYRGYAISPLGSVIGPAWRLLDGLIGRAIFAWLYNLLVGTLSSTTNAEPGQQQPTS